MRFIFIFVAAVFLGSPAFAVQQLAQYDVYASGFKVVVAELAVHTRKDRYDLSLSAETQGFLRKLAPWQGRFDTEGWVINGEYQPERHASSAIWRGEEEIKEYSYGKNGTFKKLTTTEHDKNPVAEVPDPALTENTIDALTAAIRAFEHVSTGGVCEGSADVFDGKRRFTQIFSPEKNETLTRSKYNIYEGDAARCTVEVVPITGEWHEKPRGWMSIQEQGRDRGTMPTVWAAKLSKDGPAIPVKIMVKTAYGTLFMHLTGYKEVS